MTLKHEKRNMIFAGLIIGVIASLLVLFGNPKNMGFCVACFLRDTAGALGLHAAEAVQYIRPEIIGLVFGSFFMALAKKEFSPRGGSAPVTRFVLGMFVMIGSLMFLGCPFRMILRLAGGDLNALLGLAGFACGILVGVFFLNKGYSLKRSYALTKAEGGVFPVLTLAVLALLLVCLMPVRAAAFSDVHAGDWFAKDVDAMTGDGLLRGYPDGTFQPDKTVTRAEFVSLLARIAFPEELKNETGSTWWEPAFRVCEANNLLSGTFGYSAPMPRGEIANILGTLCRGSDGVNARADAAEQFVINWNEQRMQSPAWQPMFSDTADFEMFSDALCVCVNQGLLTGYPDGTFKPENGVTRAEAAVILARLKAQAASLHEDGVYFAHAGLLMFPIPREQKFSPVLGPAAATRPPQPKGIAAPHLRAVGPHR